MKILTDNSGYIESYALIGDILESAEIEMPSDLEHFECNYRAYRVQDGKLVFDEGQATILQNEAENAQLRVERDAECFSVINRGQLWYEGVSIAQLLELRQWYKAWLNVTETMVVPEKPAWLE